MASLTRDSMTLHATAVKLTGLLFAARCLLPFLNIGDTFAIFQTFGSMPVTSDFLNMMNSGIFNSLASSFSTRDVCHQDLVISRF